MGAVQLPLDEWLQVLLDAGFDWEPRVPDEEPPAEEEPADPEDIPF